MNSLNFDMAHKQLAVQGAISRARFRHGPGRPLHRPSVALILLATTVQIIAMAAVLGTVGSFIQ